MQAQFQASFERIYSDRNQQEMENELLEIDDEDDENENEEEFDEEEEIISEEINSNNR